MSRLARAEAATTSALAPDEAWWSLDYRDLLVRLQSTPAGLRSADAGARALRFGPNAVHPPTRNGWPQALWRQFSSPLVLILVAGAVLSALLQGWVDAATIVAIVGVSAVLGFVQEMRASTAVARLQRELALVSRVRRDGEVTRVPARQLVPGDVIVLSAGNLVPADGVVLEARDFLVSEASLTGESFPVEKAPGPAAPEAPLSARRNCVFLGSSVRSGSAEVLLVHTGSRTLLADLAARLTVPATETAFELGVRHFGDMLLRVMLGVVVAVLVANHALGRPVIESLLFAVALAVGLSPELLPAIVSVQLATAARALSREGVLVRRLDAIEDLGGIDVVCTDKTGTLTAGTMELAGTFDPQGRPSDRVLDWAHLNAAFETGIENPMDAAIVAAAQAAGLATDGWRKCDEIPYDFARRRLTIVLARESQEGVHQIVTKGAFTNVVEICSRLRTADGEAPLGNADRAALEAFVRDRGQQGVRVLAVATRSAASQAAYAAADERDLCLEGFACFSDPPKADARETLQGLAALGMRVKIVTGDNRHVAAHLAAQVGLDASTMLTGEDMAGLREEALWHLAERAELFAEVDPAQKERIVRALQRTGHAVAFLGDGINDAPALHAADVGISVQNAVDVARESADIVLLERDLGVLRRGVERGRRTFANTLKYIQITISANFGNMVSMALATPLLPFLPLTASQILLNNFLSDLPALAISADRVDAQPLRAAQQWKLPEVRRFMLVFGLISSVFDLLTFWLLVQVFEAPAALFHSAWFVVSLLTELAVLLILRTRLSAWRSQPSPLLLWATLGIAAVAIGLPYLPPVAHLFGFVPLPASMAAAMVAIVFGYAAVTEMAKRWFWGMGPGR